MLFGTPSLLSFQFFVIVFYTCIGVGNMCTLITIASLFSLMQNGATPLIVASQNGHEGVVKLLLDRANVDQQDKV